MFDLLVPMPNGHVMSHHEVTRLSHALGGSTWVHVTSTEAGMEPHEWELPHEPDMTLGFEDAEAWVMGLPEFAEGQAAAMEADLESAKATIGEMASILTDEQAELVPQAFPEWAAGTAYAVGQRVRYDGRLYRCVQAHTSQEGWEPATAAALWVRTAPDGEIPDWVQPTGAHDAYNTGDKVRHVGKVWESMVDANVYEPGVYGWSEVTSS